MLKRDVLQHLSEGEVMQFFLEELPPVDKADVEQHVERCETCAQELEALYEADASFPVQEWAAREPEVAAARRKRLGEEPLESFLQRMAGRAAHLWQAFLDLGATPAPGQPLVARAASEGTVEWVDDKSEGSNFSFSAAISRETGDIVFRIDSRLIELEDWLVEIGDEGWRRGAPLARLGEYLFAEIKVTRQERDSIPTGLKFGIRGTPHVAAGPPPSTADH